ncbi:MAG TPA: hypothetical protein VGG33_18045 [Polyangia bacterium]
MSHVIAAPLLKITGSVPSAVRLDPGSDGKNQSVTSWTTLACELGLLVALWIGGY